jgi:MoaA/NifB/PqqE/SkfB family radical SAM enzyme
MKREKEVNYCRAIGRLLWNGLGFGCTKLRGAPLKPAALSLAITNRCNSHCIMCNIWKRIREQPDIKRTEMSLSEIINLLSNPLFSRLVELDLTGGEPHLRNDLADIAMEVGSLKESCLPNLKSIIVTSNGLLPYKITSNYQRILETLRNTKIDLISVVSIDGIAGTHDHIRGIKGAFNLAAETVRGLLELRLQYPNYYVGIKTTILPENIHALDAILDFALANDLFYIISPVFFTEERFRNIDKRDALELGSAEYDKIFDFYSREEFNGIYFYSKARCSLAAGRKQWSCTASYNYMFIEFDGTVYPCELISEPIGNIRKQSLKDIWESTYARYWRKKIEKTHYCRGCIEPGAIRYSAYAEGFSYLKFLVGLGRHQFHRSLDGEGFSKYFVG